MEINVIKILLHEFKFFYFCCCLELVLSSNELSFESIIESPASEEELKQLVDAVEAQCPILDTLVRSITVTGTATINGKSGYSSAKAA